jgi:hypothetical protein
MMQLRIEFQKIRLVTQACLVVAFAHIFLLVPNTAYSDGEKKAAIKAEISNPQSSKYIELVSGMAQQEGESESQWKKRLNNDADKRMRQFVKHVEPNELRGLRDQTTLSNLRVMVSGLLPAVGEFTYLEGCENRSRMHWDREIARERRRSSLNNSNYEKFVNTARDAIRDASIRCGDRRNKALGEIDARLRSIQNQLSHMNNVDESNLKNVFDNYMASISRSQSFQTNIGDDFAGLRLLDSRRGNRIKELLSRSGSVGGPKQKEPTKLPLSN